MRAPRPLTILCPTCKTGRLALESATESEIDCSFCSASFPVIDGVIDLLPGPSQPRSVSQSVMEWEPFIKIFESKWFRTGPFYSLLAGISFQEEHEMIMRAASLEGDEILLDVGCGSGIYSRPFAQKLDRGAVVGLDLSMPMLSCASERAQAQEIDNLLFIHGNAFNLPFPDNEFDAVNCSATIHLFTIPDLLKVLMQVNRALRPGGRFTASGLRNWIPGRPGRRFADWYSQKVGTNYFRPEDLEPLFKQTGFDSVQCLHSKRYWLVMSAKKPE